MYFNGHYFDNMKLELGGLYYLSFFGRRAVKTRFIQPTPKGFNFLNLQTHKCVLRHHLYPSKYMKKVRDEDNWFTIIDILNVQPVVED